VLDLGGAVAIALGGGTISGHSCALLEDGRARCWGLDDQGQLGDGKLQPRERPVEVPLEDLRVLEAGTSHTCAADKVGRLSCWGRATAFADEPVLSASGVVVPTPIAEVDGVVGLGLGDLHTCAVTGEGDVFCWGEGGEGRLGHGSTSREETPRAVTGLPEVRQVVAGRAHACALAIDGSTWCWGANDHGQLGTREPAMHARPQRLHDLPGSTSLATGWQHTCALGVDGRARCWGANDAGQLGDGTFEPRAGVHTVEDLEGVLQIAAKVRTNCARLRDGRLHCWGDNRAGQLGDGTDHDRHTPTPVRWQLGDVDDGSDAGLD
jgi:alpha-tubulin suppressor-like RCC1 family protein